MNVQSPPRIRYDYDDYVRLPDDGRRYEIIDGELFMSPSPSFFHQRLSAELFAALFNFIKEKNLGVVVSAPIDVIFEHWNVVVPDIAFVSDARADIIEKRGLVGAPDLLVEILSPSTRERDLSEKRDLYERYGVHAYWVVDPDAEQVLVYRLVEGRYAAPEVLGLDDVLTSALLPGFVLPLRALFRA